MSAYLALVNSDVAAMAMPGLRRPCGGPLVEPEHTEAHGTSCPGWTPAPEADCIVAEITWLIMSAHGVPHIFYNSLTKKFYIDGGNPPYDTWQEAVHSAALSAIEKETK